MIEKIIIDYLNDSLEVPVAAQVPAGPPESYVVLEKTGGGEKDGLRAAVLALRCVGSSLYNAIELCLAVHTAMKLLPEAAANVSGVRLESEYNQTDTRTKEYRYTGIWRVYYVEADA